jgi:hypothetical protein
VPLETENRFRVFDAQWSDDSFRPQSPLDLPIECKTEGEYFHGDYGFLNRADALAEAARRNRNAMNGDEVKGEDWFVVVESGQSMPLINSEIELTLGYVGREQRQEVFAVRIVVPTEKELRQYATK